MLGAGSPALFSLWKKWRQVWTFLVSGVVSGKVLGEIYSQEFVASHPLHCGTIDDQRGVLLLSTPLLSSTISLIFIDKDVSLALLELAQLSSIACFIVVTYEAHYSCIIHQLYYGVGAVV